MEEEKHTHNLNSFLEDENLRSPQQEEAVDAEAVVTVV